MNYCPRCRAAVTVEAQFCPHCGLSRRDAQRLAKPSVMNVEQPPQTNPGGSQLPAPSRMPTIHPTPSPLPKHDVPPQVQRIPARPNSGRHPAQSAQLMRNANQNEVTRQQHQVEPGPANQAAPAIPQQGGLPSSVGTGTSQQFWGPSSQPGLVAPLQVQQQALLSPSRGEAQLTLPVQMGNNPGYQSHPPTYRAEAAIPTSQLPPDIVKGRPPLIEAGEEFSDDEDGGESYLATSVAAEHWRTSWRDRQRNEAGPASYVSRGQSAVPEPLMAMQHSLARMRAILLPQKTTFNLRFWITLLLMLCILGGLIAFIGTTFHTNADTTSQRFQQSDAPLPSLSLSGPPSATVKQGQSLALHGENFDIGAPIIFLLDGTLAINGANKRELSVLVSDQGTFDVSIPVPLTWAGGPHVIQAFDNKNEQSAYLNIDVTLAGTAATTSSNLSLSTQHVTFHAVVGQQELPEQFVTLTNSNLTSSLQWNARAVANANLTWLDVDNATISGTIPAGASTTVGITVSLTGLQASSTPYSGNIVFTINQNEQLTLPVTLELGQNSPEIAINPNPLIGVISTTRDSCQPNSTLLLVNLSDEPVSWSLSMDSSTAAHIAFLSGGKLALQGNLAPAGQPTDNALLTLQCQHIKSGATYRFSILANTVAWPEVVTIQTAP